MRGAIPSPTITRGAQSYLVNVTIPPHSWLPLSFTLEIHQSSPIECTILGLVLIQGVATNVVQSTYSMI